MDRDGHPDIVSACEYAQCPGQIFYVNGAYQFTHLLLRELDPFIFGRFDGVAACIPFCVPRMACFAANGCQQSFGTKRKPADLVGLSGK